MAEAAAPALSLALVLALWSGLPSMSAAQRLNEGENLLVRIPPGFLLANRGGEGARAFEEFIPEGQSLDAWQELITLQLFPDLAGAAPDAYLGSLSEAFSTQCPAGQIGPVQSLGAGAYPAALILASCPDSPRTEGVESFAAYAIGGQARLYVLQYAWARLPDDADLQAAQAFFGSAFLCDTTRADAPCPGAED
jgi:hypothetical protein